MGTPVLSFRHREALDARWVSLPLYVAMLVACVWAYGHWPDDRSGSVFFGVVVGAVLLMELARFGSPARQAGGGLYGSGQPSAFVFDGDEAITSLMTAQDITRHPRRFLEQFTRSEPAPPAAVKPAPVLREAFESQLTRSGAYVLFEKLQSTLWGSYGKYVVLVILKTLAFLPLVLMDAAVKLYAFPAWWAGAAGTVVRLGVAKTLGRAALPGLVRKAAFGADQGRFVEVGKCPPGVSAHEALSEALRGEADALSRRLAQDVGQAMLRGVVRMDAFAIKAQVTEALSNTALSHSYYYQSAEVRARIADLIAASPGRNHCYGRQR